MIVATIYSCTTHNHNNISRLTPARHVLVLLGLVWLRCAAGFPQLFTARFHNDCQTIPFPSGYPYGSHGMPLPDLLGTSISLSSDDVLQSHVQAGVQYNVTVSFYRPRCALALVSSGRLSVMQERSGNGSVTTSSCSNRVAFGPSDTGDYHSSIRFTLEVPANTTAATVIQLTVVSAESEVSPFYIAKLTLPVESPAAAQAQQQQQGQLAAVSIHSGVAGSVQVSGSSHGALGVGAAVGVNTGATTRPVRLTHNTSGVNTPGLSAAANNNTSSSPEGTTMKLLPSNSSREFVAVKTSVKSGKVSKSKSTSSSYSVTTSQVPVNSSGNTNSLAVPNNTAAAGPTLAPGPPPLDSKPTGSDRGLRPPHDPVQLGVTGRMQQQRVDNSSSSSNLPSSPVPVIAGSQLPDGSSNPPMLVMSVNTSTATELVQHIAAREITTTKASMTHLTTTTTTSSSSSSNGIYMVNNINNNASRCVNSNCSHISSSGPKPASSLLSLNVAATQANLRAPPPPPLLVASNKTSTPITVVTAARASALPPAAAIAAENTQAGNWTSMASNSTTTTITTTASTTTTTTTSSSSSSNRVVNGTTAAARQVILYQTLAGVTPDKITTGCGRGTISHNSSRS